MESSSQPADEVNEKMDAPASVTPSAADQKSVASKTESTQLKALPPPEIVADGKTEVVMSEPSAPSGQTSAMPIAKEATTTVYADDELNSAEESIDVQSHLELARAKRDEGYYANQMNPALMQSRVTGLVTDAHTGAPIMSAKLAVDYSNQLFYTDIEGGFELQLPQPAAVLQVTYPGYADTALIIKPAEDHILVDLKPGSILSSNVMAGAKNKGPVPSVINDPVSSFRQFYNYITATSSLQLTSEASAARRKVTLEFTVKKDGRPTDIKVLESSRDKTYDNEARRLLDNGPDWVCLEGEYPCVRSYTFYFR